MRGKFQQLLPTRWGEDELFWSQGKLNRKRESTTIRGFGADEAFKPQMSVGMQVSSRVRQPTQESGGQNRPNASSTTCM